MSLPRYENYKDSGIEWIGEIPKGWEVKKLKYGAFVNPVKDSEIDSESLEQVTFLPMEKVSEKGEIDCGIKRPIKDLWKGFTFFRKNDVLIAKITPCFENGKGALLNKLETEIGFGSTEFHVLRAKPDTLPEFLFYTTKSEIFMRVGEAFMSGAAGQKRVPTDFISEFPLLSLPLPEQAAIASFLNRKTAELDQLIFNKEKLIALYEEEKTAIINRAVTKGLDPRVKLKPSGVEWLGDIPEHWRVKRLKSLICRLESGVSVNATDYPASGEEFGILKTSCVYNYNFNPNENKAIWPAELERAKVSPQKYSIIISRMNTPDLVGASGYVEKDYPTLFLPDRLWQTVFCQDVDIEVKWLSYVLKSGRFRELLSVTATGTSPSMKNLGQEEFLNITIPFMDIAEQTAIVAHIETECSRLDTIIEKFKKQIDLFKEYRITLISDVVTGKIDVRGEVAA